MLYKYFPNILDLENNDNKLKWDTILNQNFHFGTTKQLNDPFDLFGGNYFYLHTWIIRRIVHSVCVFIQKDNSTIQYNVVSVLVENIIIQVMNFASCSFSRVSTERLMWAHYANAYNGFCLGFDFPKETQLHKVIYLDRFPTNCQQQFDDYLHPIFSELCNKLDVNNLSTQHSNTQTKEECIRHILKSFQQAHFMSQNTSFELKDSKESLKQFTYWLLSIKSQEWVYEQEERLIAEISVNENGANLSWPQGTKLKQIIIGPRMNYRMYKDKIDELKRITQAELYKLEVGSLETFELKLSKL